MELTGQIILDEKTINALRHQIREEIINEIKEEGNYTSEIVKFMNDCSFEDYIRIIKDTIDHVVRKINKDEIWSGSTLKSYNQILTIKHILEI